MRHILSILLLTLTVSCFGQITQPGLRDYQISGGALIDSVLYILGTDTTGAKKGLGKFYRGDSLMNALGDHDFYGLGTGRPPFAGEDSIENAPSINYILLDSAKLHSYTPNYNNWFPWSQTSYKNVTGSGYLGHRHIDFDSLSFPALSEPYGRFGEWIENTSWDNSINTGFEGGGNMIHNFGFNYDMGSAKYNALRPNFKWSVEQGYYSGSGSSLWVESHWEMADTLGRIIRSPTMAAAYDGSFTAFGFNSDLTSVTQSPDESTGGGLWQQWNYPNGTDDMWYNYKGRINKRYTGTFLEKYSNLITAPTYRNILTHDADDDLWVGDSTGIDITNKLRFRINSFLTPIIKSNNYTLRFDTVFVDFLNSTADDRNFTLSTPDSADKILFGYGGSNMTIGEFNSNESIFRLHKDAPNYSLGIRSTGKLDFNINGGFGGVDFKQFSDELAGGWMTRDAAQSYYVGNYIDPSDHWVWNFNGSEYYRFKSNGQINANQYDATPLIGTPFRLLAHETDGDFISATWLQVIDSTLNNGLLDTIVAYSGGDDWGADVVNTDLTLTGDGTVGNVLKVDTSEIATQYDLTLISGGTTDLTIGGAGPTYTIESSTGTDVTIAASGISLVESPANTLEFINNGIMDYTNSSDATTHTILTTDINSDPVGATTFAEGAGISLTTTGTADDATVTIASTVDISGLMDNWLLAASGTAGTESITDNETVTITGAGINTATRSGSNVTITGTEVDGSVTNEGVLGVGAGSGTSSTLLSNTSGANAVTINAAGILAISESTSSNGGSITLTATEVDGSTTNELNIIEENNVSVQTGNITLDFQNPFDVSTDGASEVNISFDGGEFTTVTTAETDDYVLLHDSGSSANQKMLWSDFLIDLIEFKDGNSSVGTGSIIDVGAGLDIIMSPSNEANINIDPSEWQIDGTGDSGEYVVIHDSDTTAGHQLQRRLVSSFGGTDFNMAEDNLTFTGNRVHDTDNYSLTFQGPVMNVKFLDENGGTGNTIQLVSELGAGTGITGGISYQFENAGAGTEQYDIEANKRSATQSTLMISAEQNTDAEIIFEKNADLADNTTESHLAINGGIAFTQNYEWTGTASDLTLDRSYYNVIVTGSGAIGDEINLPNVFSTLDNWATTMTATDCQVGQEYVITNFRAATNLVIRTNTGDFINGAATTTLTLAPFDSVILKCVRLNGTTGYWFSYD